MPPSYRKIDYSLRPAKHAERRMLCDIFGRLSAFDLLQDYAYSGMGSVWFADFLLLHKVLGVRHMTTIEWPRGSVARINDNIPLKCISPIHKTATQAIPELDWERRQIVWLDYDSLLTPGILVDVEGVAKRARSGSIVVVSVQCNRADETDRVDGGADPITLFKDTFGRDGVGYIDDQDLYGWNFASVCRRLITQQVQASLALRNVLLPPDAKMNYEVLCGFEYADDAKMTTVAVVFYSDAELQLYKKCWFGRLEFLQSIGDVVRIEMPKLTLNEMRWLQRQLPTDSLNQLDVRHIPESDALRFAKLYRYYPNFAVLEG